MPAETSLYLGVDIGGTKIGVCLGDSQARILARSRLATKECGTPEQTLARVAAVAAELAGGRLPAVAQVGVSCAGPLDADRGVVLSPPNLPGWDEVPVCGILGERLGKPVRLENDANAAALAEWRFGAGRGTRDMVFLTCSTGLGAGIIAGGRLLRGHTGLAGEAGHLRLTEDGPRAYGKAGSLEGWASGSGLAQQAGRPAEDVGRAALAGDPQAVALITRAGEMLGRGLAILCDVLDPEIIVCGTLALRLGDLYLEPARRVLAREALRPCPVVSSCLGDDLPEMAALAVALPVD
jgi:glucokinase